MTTLSRRGARRRWLAAWLVGPVVGIANGVVRETTYGRRMPELRAHQVSTATALAAFAGLHVALDRRWPLPDARTAAEVGAAWTAATIAFEVGFGRAVGHQDWSAIREHYDVRRGRLWPLLLAWLAVGPAVVRAARR